jgi:predicted amidohydrolase
VALRARAQDNRLFVLSASHAQAHVPGRPPEWGYSGICCAIDPLGVVIGESRGRAGHPQHITVTLEAASQRTYLLADVPAIRERRPRAYSALTSEQVQRSYVKSAAPFRYNDRVDRLTVPQAGRRRGR